MYRAAVLGAFSVKHENASSSSVCHLQVLSVPDSSRPRLTGRPSRLPSVQTTCSGSSVCTVVCTLVRLDGDARDGPSP